MKREQAYYRYAKLEHYLDLYAECMQSEPLYIPKKFRKDNQHVVSPSEVPVLRKMEIDSFRAECEILCIKRDEYTAKCITFDNELQNIIAQYDCSEVVKSKLHERWETLINEDIARINGKWKKKIFSIRSVL